MDGHRSKPGSPEAAKAEVAGATVDRTRSATPNVSLAAKAAADGQNAGWFLAGRDFREKLVKLKLLPDERMLLLSIPTEADAVIEKLKAILEEREKLAKRFGPRSQSRTTEFCVKFSEFVSRISGIVHTLLPQGPEYTVVFGMLMILFKAVVTKRDREESLLLYLDMLTAKLPLPDSYRKIVPTNAMKLALVTTFAQLTGLIDDWLIYYRSGKLGKLVDILIQPTEPKFAGYIAQIDAEVRKISDPKSPAQKPKATDVIKGESGKVASRLSSSIDETAIAIGISMELLTERVAGLESRISQMSNFGMIQYAQSLDTALSSNPMDVYWDPADSLARLATRGFRLAPKDHWENNGILETLSAWSRGPQQAPLLWIGGQSGNQEPWVTELCADMVQAFHPQPVTLLYAFCSDLLACKITPTPTRLVKGLIKQILSLHPEIAYKDPLHYSVPRFQHAAGFRQAWQIFESLIEKTNNAFIVIDRIEECVPDEQSDLTKHFLPALIHLLRRTPGAKAVVTSVYEPPDELIGLDEAGLLESVFIDTAIPTRELA